MNFASIIDNDIVDSDTGMATSLWFNGCCFRCKNCHNSQLWEANNPKDNNEVVDLLYKSLTANGIKRNLSILGGEPLMPANRGDCAEIISLIKERIPDLKIYIWTGYTMESLLADNDVCINSILNTVDVLIDGLFIEEKKRLGLKLRGSSNQNVYRRKDNKLVLDELS